MTHELEIRADFNHFYLGEQKFFPMVQEQDLSLGFMEMANTVLIRLKAHPDDELIWDTEKHQAKQAIEEGKMILWELDFGFSSKPVLLSESSLFYSCGIAIEEFVKTIWTEYKTKTVGVVLYRGDLDFSSRFIWTEQQREFFTEKIQAHPYFFEEITSKGIGIEEWISTPHGHRFYQLFCADVFSEYFHRLISYLPDTALPICLLDVSHVESSAFLAQLLSKERFQHLLFGLKKAKIPLGHLNWEEGAALGGWLGGHSPYFSSVSEVKIGVCLPPDEEVYDEVLQLLDSVFEELGQRGLAYRIIPEAQLTEAWDGLDDIIVISSSLTFQGKRRLFGFCAAGGRVVSVGEEIGLAQESLFNDFLKEHALVESATY